MPRKARGYWLEQRSEGGSWYIKWTEARVVRSRSTGTRDRAAAEEALASFNQTRASPPPPPEPSVKDIVTAYLTAKKGELSAYRTHESALNRVTSRIGWLKVAELRPSHGGRYVKQRQTEGVAISTARQELVMLRTALRYGAHNSMCPSVKLDIPATAPSRERWLTREEASRLITACHSRHVRLFIVLALHTAARSTALLELRWDKVDMERRIIDLGRKAGQKGRAVVPINDVLLAELRAAQAVATSSFVVEYAGQPIKEINQAFRRAAKKAELEDLTPHDLRRTSASWMLQGGVPIEQVSRYLGHSSITVTARVYARHTTQWLEAASKVLAGVK